MTPFLLVSGDFVRTGGMDRANYALASYLARQGHPVHLVTHRVEDDLRALPSIRVHHVPKVGNSYLLAGPALDGAGRWWARRLARRQGRVVVNGGNCPFGDVNWIHYVHAAYRPATAGGLVRRAKAALSHRLFRRAEARAVSRARLVVTNSRATRAAAIDRLGAVPERTHTVYYGTDGEQFRPAGPGERDRLRERLGCHPERPLVAFIGALGDRRKGFDTAFAAWSRLCADRSWDAELVVVGAGAELPRWRERTQADARLAGRVRFLGFQRDVAGILRACDALVAPTRYEAYGLGVHEALCCGLPAIVSAAAGVAERYPDSLRGFLLPDPKDDADLAARLRAWRAGAGRGRADLEKLSEALRQHTWDRMAEEITTLIEQSGV
jgi:glycosyltransferase involved in cell wall biosynthesis